MSLLFLVPLASCPCFSDQHVPKRFFASLLTLGLVLSFLYRAARAGKIVFRSSFLTWSWGFFLGAILLSLGVVLNPADAAERLLYWMSLFLLHVWATGFVSFRDFSLPLVMGGTIAAAYGAYQSLSPDYLHTYPVYVSTFGNVNFAAACMAMILPLLAGMMEGQKRWTERSACVCAMGVVFFYLMQTSTRSAWIACAAGMLAFMAFRVPFWVRKYKQEEPGRIFPRKTIWALLCLPVVFSLPFWSGERRAHFAQRAQELTQLRSGSVRVRALLWQSTWEMANQRIVGVGAGQFSHHFYRHRSPEEYEISQGRMVDHPHNTWLLIGAESGPSALFFALCILGGTLWIAARESARAWKKDPEGQSLQDPPSADDSSGASVLGCAITFSVLSLFGSPLASPATGIVLPLMSGWAAGKSGRESVFSVTSFLAKSSFVVFSMFALGIAVLGAGVNFRRTVGDLFFMSGESHFQAKSFEKANRQLQTAVSWWSHGLYRVELARSFLALKRYEVARTEFESTLRDNPELENAHIDLGLCDLALGRPYRALKTWSEAHEFFPRSKVLNENLARLLLSCPLAKSLVQIESENMRFEMLKGSDDPFQSGIAYEFAGDLKKALVRYIDAKEQGKEKGLASLQVGGIMSKIGLIDAALHHLTEASQEGSANVRSMAYVHLGMIYEQENNRAMALTYYLKAAQIDQNNPEPYLYMAQLAARSGRSDIVQKYLDHARELGFFQWKGTARHPFFKALVEHKVFQTYSR